MSELQVLLRDVAEVHHLGEYPGMPEVEETGDTFVGNAVLKAEAVAAYTGKIALADDSGIAVDALQGAPGIYSARYAGSGATDAQNRAKLLQALEHVPEAQRTAQFVCAIALAVPGRPTWTATGTHAGLVLFAERGDHGFGYDPLFYSPELGATFAEVSLDVKNKVSHRARALEQLRRHLLANQLIDHAGGRML